jgi:hypothetical protein
MNDTMQAFADLLTAATPALEVYAIEASGTGYGERDTLRYHVRVQQGALRLDCDWSCGSAIPLLAWKEGRVKVRASELPLGCKKDTEFVAHAVGYGARLTNDVVTIRTAIRRRFRPSLADVMGSLLSDDASVSGYHDWLDWAEDFGSEGAEALRKARTGWAQIQERAPVLRRMLGSSFDALQALATAL